MSVDVPKWVKTWAGIVGAIGATIVLVGDVFDFFKEKPPKSDKPAIPKIEIVMPDQEPEVMPILRHIDKGVEELKKEMGINGDSTLVGQVDSIFVDSLKTRNVGGE